MRADGLYIEQTFEKIYAKAKRFGFWHEIWQVKFNWRKIKWSMVDKIVLKIMQDELNRAYKEKISKCCVYVKDHGGLKSTVQELQDKLASYKFAFRTDIKKYYQSIDHYILHNKLCAILKNNFVQRLLWQYMDRIKIVNGKHRQIKKGIAKGRILSILTKTSSELRKLVKLTYKIMKDLKLTLNPDKTFIGRIRKGFDFLGYRFTRNGLRLACSTIQRFQAKLTQLYEQGTSTARIEQYRKNWLCWAASGGLKSRLKFPEVLLPAVS
jgi:GTP1/Obg family GTP-binding protein